MDFNAFLLTTYKPALFLLSLMFGDFIFGVIVALKQKRFSWDQLPQFLLSDGAWILAWFFADGMLYFFKDLLPTAISTALGAGLYLPVAGKIGASLLGHFSALGVLTNALNRVAVNPTGVEDREDAVG